MMEEKEMQTAETVQNKNDFVVKKSIQKKLTSSFALVLSITLIVSLVLSECTLFFLQKRSESQLINQALTQADVFTGGQADTISEQISGIESKLAQTARFAEYIYSHTGEFSPRAIPTPDNYLGDASSNVMHWLPFYKEDTNNPTVVAEANLLASLEPEFRSVMETCPMIISLYVATETKVNIGYDKNVLDKRGIGAYDPVAADAVWYKKVISTKKAYISDTYNDTFDRGLMVTISEPYFVNGEIRGVIGADIVIQNINENVLNIDTGSRSGYAMLFSASGEPISAANMTDKTTAAELLGNEENVKILNENAKGSIKTTIDGNDVYVIYSTVEATGWKLAVVLDINSVLAPAKASNKYIFGMIVLLTIIYVALFMGMILFIRNRSKKLSEPLLMLSEDVEKIGNGDLDFVNRIKTEDELELLGKSFEKMTDSLKEYIQTLTSVTAEKERISAELDVAAHIQSSMLPCVFPAFPDKKEFDVYATMNPAKEVGGDFYDFFMVDDRHIAIVMADVSGKGVPAALFMVIGKTLIQDHTQPDCNLGEVFSMVNNLLCDSNSEGLFITAFEGVLDLVTGEFVFVNAGHEMPYICKGGEKFEPYKIRPGFVLAGMEDMRYKGGLMKLEPGDKIFQYTDGVTEATNAHNELYGQDRLTEILQTCSDKNVQEILPIVKDSIDTFVGEAPQFDDITMLCLEYKERMVLEDK